VLASGADVPYPRSNEALLARIAAEGLVVSEAPPGGLPLRRRFLVRNRLDRRAVQWFGGGRGGRAQRRP